MEEKRQGAVAGCIDGAEQRAESSGGVGQSNGGAGRYVIFIFYFFIFIELVLV